MLTAAIAPKQPSELSWNEILEVLDRQFGSAKTLFRRRFECFKMRYDGQEFNNYELLVKTKCTDAKLDTIDFDGLQCLFYVAGFQGPNVADYRTRLLRKLDQSEKVTLKDLTAECQLVKSYKEDSRMLEGDPSINFVRRKKRFRRKKSFNQQRQQKNEPNPAYHRSESKESMPRHGSMPRRESMSRRGSTTHYRRNRQINNVIAALKRDDHPHLDVIINGHATTLLLDTGAEVTIVSEAKWKQLAAPRLQKTDVIGYAANGSPLKFRGCFETDFVVSDSSGGLLPGRGTCYVTEDDCNVFGIPWIKQLPDLYKAQNAKNPIKTLLCSWPVEDKPWSRIHADFAGPIDGRMYLVIVDAYSKWPEIMEMSSTTSTATIKEFSRIFSQFGYPETLVTDNGTQFSSKEFNDFCTRNGIKHRFSPPFHPQSNGQAERFVDTFKRTLQKLRGERTTQEALQKFLFAYRRTPSPTLSGKSPAEVFLGRRLRSTLTLLNPSQGVLEPQRNWKMEAQFNHHHGARSRIFEPNDLVWTRDYRAGYPRWSQGRELFGLCLLLLPSSPLDLEQGYWWKNCLLDVLLSCLAEMEQKLLQNKIDETVGLRNTLSNIVKVGICQKSLGEQDI
ncbi:integrase core domain protein [Teladorsagia circumcincta]|uniref:Integrase core domain protein n=1 Tax=Teladorsagia circumcincta TaxID=45464 RepID=A0A2G9UYY4_TELCI|nr:integrase core domain protein [Teladorsagia circumcincta]